MSHLFLQQLTELPDHNIYHLKSNCSMQCEYFGRQLLSKLLEERGLPLSIRDVEWPTGEGQHTYVLKMGAPNPSVLLSKEKSLCGTICTCLVSSSIK